MTGAFDMLIDEGGIVQVGGEVMDAHSTDARAMRLIVLECSSRCAVAGDSRRLCEAASARCCGRCRWYASDDAGAAEVEIAMPGARVCMSAR
jgi:hypothetical protein